MTRDELIRTLREDLKVKKEIVAIKVMKDAPEGIPAYEGQATPGMCAMVGEILREGSHFYAVKENMGCFEALLATGACRNLPRDEYLAFMVDENKQYPMHRDAEAVIAYYNRVDEFFKHPKVDGTGIVAGPLALVDDPDLVLLFVTPHQADILNRIRAYYGEYTRGFGGLGGCIFTIRYSYVTGDPAFTTSDTAWRMFAGLDLNELTYTFPYGKLLQIAYRIKPTADYVDGFTKMFVT